MKEITIFTTNTCAYCQMVKKYLQSKNVSYTEVNLDENPDQRSRSIELSGAHTVPVTLIDDSGTPNVIVGWNPSRLAAAIA